ncbi:hypothetical protein LOK49_LG08G01442 [Camellia lanceoleosa]|uniref:Uncharacterized protein n=1 Tax=Camellia lanceoleosa TaxID=1840588 RepID=A0ACC0GMR8_9ERIC|nr:hypothetical protein LOK49_LG08G01442 [Camellia lanceoleosa]
MRMISQVVFLLDCSLAYVARVNAMVRGAARGITVPMNLSALWSSLQLLLHEMDGASGVAVESSFFQTLFNGLVKDGEILGSLQSTLDTQRCDAINCFYQFVPNILVVFIYHHPPSCSYNLDRFRESFCNCSKESQRFFLFAV